MLDQCWASVVDAGPTLDQHWIYVPCLLGAPTSGAFRRHPKFIWIKTVDGILWTSARFPTKSATTPDRCEATPGCCVVDLDRGFWGCVPICVEARDINFDCLMLLRGGQEPSGSIIRLPVCDRLLQQGLGIDRDPCKGISRCPGVRPTSSTLAQHPANVDPESGIFRVRGKSTRV